MRQHLAWPHIHLRPVLAVHGGSPPTVPAPQSVEPRASPQGDRWQTVKDKLAVAAVALLVLSTVTVFVLYLVQQAPHFRAGELTGFATPAPAAVQGTAGATAGDAASDAIAGTGLGRIPLILISTVVEMGIFVALGLYLRHDMKRKP